MRFLLPLPLPFEQFRPWRNVSNPRQANALALRLRKFWSTPTPPRTLENGETWGNGQLEVLMNHNEVYRGQIAETKPYLGDVLVPTAEGVSLKFKFKWLARKRDSIKVRQLEIHEPSWRWELLQSFTISFTIREFRQSKDCSWKGILYPKRLFFRNNEGEQTQFCEGRFHQNHDPENLELKDGVLIDPLQID